MDGYTLTRNWFNFAIGNYKCKSIHTALYLWIVELNNRVGWATEFGLPTEYAMQVLSIGDKRTYLSAIKDLTEWGFIVIIEDAKNQHQARIISLCHSKITTPQKVVPQQNMQRHNTNTCTGTTPIVKPIKPLNLKTKSVFRKESLKGKEETTKEKEEKINLADNVTVTKEQHILLIESFGDSLADSIKVLSVYKHQEGKEYDSDYHALLNFRNRNKNKPKINTPQTSQFRDTNPMKSAL